MFLIEGNSTVSSSGVTNLLECRVIERLRDFVVVVFGNDSNVLGRQSLSLDVTDRVFGTIEFAKFITITIRVFITAFITVVITASIARDDFEITVEMG